MTNNDKFPKKVLELFNKHYDKVRIYSEENNKIYGLDVFSPLKKEDYAGFFPNFMGYTVMLEKNMDRVKISIRELRFRIDARGLKWDYTEDEPIELIFFKNYNRSVYQEVEVFEQKYNDFLEEEKETRTEKIKEMFIKNKFVLDDPVVTFLKERSKVEKEQESFQQEPFIMDFSDGKEHNE